MPPRQQKAGRVALSAGVAAAPPPPRAAVGRAAPRLRAAAHINRVPPLCVCGWCALVSQQAARTTTPLTDGAAPSCPAAAPAVAVAAAILHHSASAAGEQAMQVSLALAAHFLAAWHPARRVCRPASTPVPFSPPPPPLPAPCRARQALDRHAPLTDHPPPPGQPAHRRQPWRPRRSCSRAAPWRRLPAAQRTCWRCWRRRTTASSCGRCSSWTPRWTASGSKSRPPSPPSRRCTRMRSSATASWRLSWLRR